MLSEYGPPFLYWLMRKTSGFYDYLESWAELFDDAEADV